MKKMNARWLGTAVLAVPMVALAAPPFTHDNNRNAVRSLYVGDCDGEQCISLQGGETYDLKGDYQYSFLSLTETSRSNGAFSQRYLNCPLERGLIIVRQDASSASLETSVNAADCDTGGTVCDSDLNCEDWGYTGNIGISAMMSAPVGAYSETSNVQLRDGPAGIPPPAGRTQGIRIRTSVPRSTACHCRRIRLAPGTRTAIATIGIVDRPAAGWEWWDGG